MRTALVVTFRLALMIAIASMGYLLFVFGHTELTSHEHVLEVACVTLVSALIAGLLAWAGLPEDETKPKQPLKRFLKREGE